jgi:hypothetical protein
MKKIVIGNVISIDIQIYKTLSVLTILHKPLSTGKILEDLSNVTVNVIQLTLSLSIMMMLHNLSIILTLELSTTDQHAQLGSTTLRELTHSVIRSMTCKNQSLQTNSSSSPLPRVDAQLICYLLKLSRNIKLLLILSDN